MLALIIGQDLIAILLTWLTQSSGVDVNVIAHKRQHIAVWSGGSILAENVSDIGA